MHELQFFKKPVYSDFKEAVPFHPRVRSDVMQWFYSVSYTFNL